MSDIEPVRRGPIALRLQLRHLNWFQRSSPWQVFAGTFIALVLLLIVLPIAALVLCLAFVP